MEEVVLESSVVCVKVLLVTVGVLGDLAVGTVVVAVAAARV